MACVTCTAVQPVAAARLGRAVAQRAAAGAQRAAAGAQRAIARSLGRAAAPARRQGGRRPLHVVGVRVENEDVELGTKAPDFEVRCKPLSMFKGVCGRLAGSRLATQPALRLPTITATPAVLQAGRVTIKPPSCQMRVTKPCLDLKRRRTFHRLALQLLEPLTGQTVRLSSYAAGAPATLVMFICNHCPFVVHLKPAITELVKEYQAKGVKVVAISSNSTETHPQVSAAGWRLP